MKVELDLSTEQLQELDKGLIELLKTLNEDQKVELIKAYLESKMDENLYKKKDSFYGGRYNELSDFGKEVFDGLQDRIKDSITDRLFSNEQLKEDINKTIDYIKSNLNEIIETSISTYVVNNLFMHQQDLQEQIRRTIYDMKNRSEL